MNVKITSRKFKAKDSTKDFISDEIRSLSKFCDDILDVDVILSFENPKDSPESVKTAEIIVQMPGKVLTAIESTDEFEKSVSSAIEKLQKQMEKVKAKRTDYHRVEKFNETV